MEGGPERALASSFKAAANSLTQLYKVRERQHD